MAKQKKTIINDVSALLAGLNNTENPKKKSDIPEIIGHEEQADRAYEAYKAAKDAEAVYAAVEAEIVEIAAKEYQNRTTSGEFTKSMDFPGKETLGVQVTYKDQFSAFPITEKENLRNCLGDQFDVYFQEKRDLSLVDTSDETIQLLLGKLGEETFRRIFSVKITIITKPDMDRKQFELPEDVRPKQCKAAVKIRK